MLTLKQLARRSVDAMIREFGKVTNAERLPSFFHGSWVWLDRGTWETVYLRYERYMGATIREQAVIGGCLF